MGQKWNLSLLNSLHRSSWTYSTPLDSIQERAKGLVFRLPPNPSLFVPNLPIAILFCPLIILFCPSLPHSSLNHSSCLICLQWQAAPDLLSPAERPSHLHSQQHKTCCRCALYSWHWLLYDSRRHQKRYSSRYSTRPSLNWVQSLKTDAMEMSS